MNNDASRWGIETHRGFTNSWECDENAHLNVQFYYRRFEEASRFFMLAQGATVGDSEAVRRRHVRYHRELHEGDGTVIHSKAFHQGDSLRILHRMTNTRTGHLAASAMDTISRNSGLGSAAETFPDDPANDEMISPGLPRGLADETHLPVATAGMIEDGSAIITNRSILRAGDCSQDGRMHSSAIISRFTDGAKHVWDHAGITANWLTGNGYGRVAVEMNLTRHTDPAGDDALVLVSWVPKAEGRTFVIRHQLESATTLQPVAGASVRCLVMDLETRRAVSLPSDVRVSGPE